MRLKFVKKASMPNPVKRLGYLSATARVALNLLKALAVISDTNVRRSAVDREDLKPYWKSEKRPHKSIMINKSIIYKLFKYFINNRRKTNREVVFAISR